MQTCRICGKIIHHIVEGTDGTVCQLCHEQGKDKEPESENVEEE